MNQQLFRKKSMDRISSPEQLHEYLRVSTPSVWMILASVVILLSGVCAWAMTGHLETTVSAAAVSENGIVKVYISEEDAIQIRPGQTVRCGELEGVLTEISTAPVQVSASFDPYLCHTGNFAEGQWVYTAMLDLDGLTGIQRVSIITETISPMAFLLN